MSDGSVLFEVGLERERQDEKFGHQDYLTDGTGGARVNLQHTYQTMLEDARSQNDAVPNIATWESVLREEFCEAMLESDPDKLRAELVQVAAVAVKWIEALDRRKAKRKRPFSIKIRPSYGGKDLCLHGHPLNNDPEDGYGCFVCLAMYEADTQDEGAR